MPECYVVLLKLVVSPPVSAVPPPVPRGESVQLSSDCSSHDEEPVVLHRQTDTYLGCLGGAAVQHRTRDRKVAGSTPGRGANKSTRSTQPSIPPG